MTHYRINRGGWVPAGSDYKFGLNHRAWFSAHPDSEVDGYYVPLTNIRETADDFRIEMAVPGYSREDISITLENQVLAVTGKVAGDDGESNERMVRGEFWMKPFSRRFRLSEWVDGTHISARYENGILTVTVPKREELKPKPARNIDIA
jgi:HSP20 family protein